MDRQHLKVFDAAVEFAKADEEYLKALHLILHKGTPQELKPPTLEELSELYRLQSKRNELEELFLRLWVGDGWQPPSRFRR